jgi:hypothetical protein
VACADDSDGNGGTTGDAGTTADAGTPASNGWDESNTEQGELSGDLLQPTPITLTLGDNRIVATSVPGAEEQCIGNPENPDAPETPYYPEHESYTDTFTFTLSADQKLTAILIERLDVTQVHTACGIPLEQQLGAFTGLANSAQIDWNSDTFQNFVKLPETYPLVGAGFAGAVNDDLLAQYKAGFEFGPFNIPALAEDPSDGTYTFWWKEGANRVEYTLNFVVEAK